MPHWLGVRRRFTPKTTILHQYAERFGNPRRRSSGKPTQNAAWAVCDGFLDCFPQTQSEVIVMYSVPVLCVKLLLFFLYTESINQLHVPVYVHVSYLRAKISSFLYHTAETVNETHFKNLYKDCLTDTQTNN